MSGLRKISDHYYTFIQDIIRVNRPVFHPGIYPRLITIFVFSRRQVVYSFFSGS